MVNRRLFLQQATLFGAALASAKVLSSCSPSPTASSDAAAQSPVADITELNFGIISTESQANQKPLWEPFVAAMSEELGIPVKAFYATQYAGIIEAMRFNQVQMAWYGGKAYIEAAKIAEAEAFASTIALDGSQGYYSHLIMSKDNPKTAEAKAMGGDKYILANSKDLTFAFNDPNSTSGFLVPSYYVFAQNDVDPNQAFKRLVFSGSHEATALAVANNQVDVATNNSESLSRLEKTNAAALEKIEVVWTSPEIPSDPIAYRKDLPEELKEQIRNFFYTYSDEAILGPLEWSGFVEANDERWNTIRELEVGKQILEVQADNALSQADKDQKLAELNQQLADLKAQ